MSPKLAAAVLLAVLAACLVLGYIWTTPAFPPVAGGRDFQEIVDPSVDFSPAEIKAGNELGVQLGYVKYGKLAAHLAIAIALGFSPLGARMVAAVARPPRGSWWRQVLLGGLSVLLVFRLCTLPFSAWGKAVLQKVGLSTNSWTGWAIDIGKNFIVDSAFIILGVLVLLWIARRWPVWWWAVGSVWVALLTVVLTFAYPVIVEPILNNFTPMAEGPLRASLLELATTDGVPSADVLVADASRRTSALNAYVSGFGMTRRIVVYDTLLRRATADQIRSTIAHELGHVKANDPLVGTLLDALLRAVEIVALFLLISWPPLLRQAGVKGIFDGCVIALLLALVEVMTLFTAPLKSWASRRIEARADVHSLDLTRDPATFIEKHRLYALTGKIDLTPDPAWFTWYGDHPTTVQRIAIAREWAKSNGIAVPPGLSPDRQNIKSSPP